MSQKLYCVESESRNVERLWKAKKYRRPELRVAKHYADRVEVRSGRVIIHLGPRSFHQVSKANVWKRLPTKGWKCLRLDYPDTEWARKQKLRTES